MSANYTPQNAQVAVGATANTSLSPNNTDSGVYTLVAGAATWGSYINSITIKATGSVSEGMIRIFSDSMGTSPIGLIMEIRVPAQGQSGTYPAFEITVPCRITIGATNKIYVTSQIANNFVVTASAFLVFSVPS